MHAGGADGQARCHVARHALLRECGVDTSTGRTLVTPFEEWKTLLSLLCAAKDRSEAHPEFGSARRCTITKLTEEYPQVHLRGALGFAYRSLFDQNQPTGITRADGTFFVPSDDEGLERMFNSSMELRQPLSLFGPLDSLSTSGHRGRQSKVQRQK